MMRGGALLILGHGVKGQGQLLHFVNKTLWTLYRLQFFPLPFKLNMQVVHDETRNPIDFWSRGQRSRSTLSIKPSVHYIDYSFAHLLLHFTCKLFMMKGGTLLILGHGVKGQGQLLHFVNKTLWTLYRLQFFPLPFKLNMQVVHDETRNPIDFWSRGQRSRSTLSIKPSVHYIDYSFAHLLLHFTCKLFMMKGGTLLFLGQGAKVKVKFGTVSINPCGHDTDYSFCPITFKLHM